MINELTATYGWIPVRDGYSLSESHPFYVEAIFGGVRVIWENNSLDFYEVGRLYEALRFHNLIYDIDWGRYQQTINDTWFVYPDDEPSFSDDIIFYSFNECMYYRGEYNEKGGCHESIPLIFSGDLWKYGDRLPPPHLPLSPNTAPLAEATTTATTIDDEITVDKLEKRGWYVGMASPHINHYDHNLYNDVTINFRRIENEGRTTWELEDVVLMIIEEGRSLNIPTMTELDTLIRWLS